jgi:hypothetical protein
MTTRYLEAAPVDETLERARQVKFSGFLKTAFFGVFFIMGWTAGRAWLTVVFCAFAVSEGWHDGAMQPRKPKREPQRQE